MCIEEPGQAGLPGKSRAAARTHPIIFKAVQRKRKSTSTRATRPRKRQRQKSEDAQDGDDEASGDENDHEDNDNDEPRSEDTEDAEDAQDGDDEASGDENDNDDDESRPTTPQLAEGPPISRKGPRPLTAKENFDRRRAKNRIRNEKRRILRRAAGPRRRSEQEQTAIAECLLSTLVELVSNQIELSAVITHGTPLNQVLEVDALVRGQQSLAPLPFEGLEPGPLVDMLAAWLRDPLHFDPDPWVVKGVLVEDQGQYVPGKTARFYIRVATIQPNFVEQSLFSKMKRKPAEIAWLALIAALHGVEIKKIAEAAGQALRHYLLDGTAALVETALLIPSFFPPILLGNTADTLTHIYTGVTIASTPHMRLEDDLWTSNLSRFCNLGKRLRWRTFHIPALDIRAPNGPLAFRTNPAIGRAEALLVNMSHQLGMNTTPGGTWIPSFLPPSHITTVVQQARSSIPVLPPPLGLPKPCCQRLAMLLDDEYRYWQARVGVDNVCVKETLASIKENIIDAAWTVEGTVVMVTVAEDITEEERTGRISGIETATAGPAMKEAMHFVRLLHPTENALRTPKQLRRIRGPFANLYRLQAPEDRAPHLLFLSRLLITLNPVLIVGWSNTIHRAFTRSELKDVFTNSSAQRLAFLDGDGNRVKDVLPKTWYSDGTESRGRHYIDAVGTPIIAFHGPHREDLHIYIPNIQPGAIKQDFALATELRCIFYVVQGGVVEPALHIVEQDLLANGPMDRTDADALTVRLIHLRDTILEHARHSGVMAVLDELKSAYHAKHISLQKLRGLYYSSVVAGIDEESTTCPSTPEEEDAETSEGKPYRHAVVAATGKTARLQQLRELEDEATASDLHGRPRDPYGYAPFGMAIGTPEFTARFLGLRDGQDLAQTGRINGRSAAANKAQLDNQARIGIFNTNAAAARRVADGDGLTTVMRNERSNRTSSLRKIIDTVQDPRCIENIPFVNSYRWATCQDCKEVVLGSSRNSVHVCVFTGATTKVTQVEYPDVDRIVYIHDIIENHALFALLEEHGQRIQTRMVAKSVADIFANPDNRRDLLTALPHDHHLLLPTLSQSLVYLPKSLEKEEALWVTLAVDVLLREQSQCPPLYEVRQAVHRNAWKEREGKAMLKWDADRNIKLYVFYCDGGGHSVTSNLQESDDGTWYLHTCDHGRDRIREHQRASDKNSMPTGSTSIHGTRSCPHQHFHQVHNILDLPYHYARFLWLQRRLLPPKEKVYNLPIANLSPQTPVYAIYEDGVPKRIVVVNYIDDASGANVVKRTYDGKLDLGRAWSAVGGKPPMDTRRARWLSLAVQAPARPQPKLQSLRIPTVYICPR
ncbi:hypothetical protein C8R44DRAFT_883933 [Mycena epipterygia]|nr:hypothetical protein C8R44DRAFT_883933 [Mycena epipterygia]